MVSGSEEAWCGPDTLRPPPNGSGIEVCRPGEICGTDSYEEWSSVKEAWVTVIERDCMDPKGCSLEETVFRRTDIRKHPIRKFLCSTCQTDLCNGASDPPSRPPAWVYIAPAIVLNFVNKV